MQILFQNSFKLHSHISWFSSALGSLIYCQNTSTEALMDGGGYRMWEWSRKDSGPSREWMMKLNQMHFTCYSNKPFHNQRVKWKLYVCCWTVRTQMKFISREVGSWVVATALTITLSAHPWREQNQSLISQACFGPHHLKLHVWYSNHLST